MPKVQSFTGVAILAATGYAAALFFSGSVHAGPFQWLTGKNQQKKLCNFYQQVKSAANQ